MAIPHNFDLLVFDWDGTVVDSPAHIVASLQAAAADIGLEVPEDLRCRHIIGLGMADALAYLFPQLEMPRYHELSRQYRHHYLAKDHELQLFEGAYEAICGFHAAGFQLAVATGKSRAGLQRALQSSRLEPRFHASRCADEGRPKPYPDMLQHLMERLGVAAERTLMIGDTTHDLQMARNAGVEAIAVAYGAHPLHELNAYAPLACVQSFAELVRWIEQNG